MRGFPSEHQVFVPKNLDEALERLSDLHHRWLPFAGGTDLMVILESGRLPPSRFVALWGLRELREISITNNELSIGGGVTYAQIRHNRGIIDLFPMIAEAAAATGALAIQSRGTLGGNIANASPAADTPPALLAYNAQIEMVSKRGFRTVPYESFHLGYKKTALAADELISRIILPRPIGQWICAYRKVGTRRAQSISKTVFAGAIKVDPNKKVDEVRLAFGSVGPTPLRARHAENSLIGQSITSLSIETAILALYNDLSPMDDIRSSKKYRMSVSCNILRQFLDGASQQ